MTSSNDPSMTSDGLLSVGPGRAARNETRDRVAGLAAMSAARKKLLLAAEAIDAISATRTRNDENRKQEL